jgi:hypothetical protein
MKQEIIYTDVYALIVSDEIITVGDFYYERCDIMRCEYKEEANDLQDACKKVIAHRPLTDAPILEGVPLLPEFSQEEEVEEVASTLFRYKIDNLEEIHSDYILGFQEGHRKAKETHKYTEEDLIKAFKAGHSGAFVKEHTVPHYKEYIRSIQQSKRPKYFEYETIYRVKSGTIQEHKDGLAGFEYYEPKTITNPQGQVKIKGEYIYE